MNHKLKIMYLNPVGFDAYDSFFAEMIKENKFPNSEVHVTSLNSSVGQMDNLEYRTYNALISADLTRFGLFKPEYKFGNRIIVE